MELSDQQIDQLRAYAAAVRASPHNLLSKRGLEELESRHIAESLGVARLLPRPTAHLLDLGTGGGLPGLVVAIARPDIRVTLLDATRKKVEFVAAVARDLGVDVQVAHGRAEELVHRLPAVRADVVTARAVAPLVRLLPWAMPWLAPAGQLWALKGQKWEDELRAATPVLRRLGAVVLATPNQLRPQGDAQAAGGEFTVLQPGIVMLGRSSSRA